MVGDELNKLLESKASFYIKTEEQIQAAVETQERYRLQRRLEALTAEIKVLAETKEYLSKLWSHYQWTHNQWINEQQQQLEYLDIIQKINWQGTEQQRTTYNEQFETIFEALRAKRIPLNKITETILNHTV